MLFLVMEELCAFFMWKIMRFKVYVFETSHFVVQAALEFANLQLHLLQVLGSQACLTMLGFKSFG